MSSSQLAILIGGIVVTLAIVVWGWQLTVTKKAKAAITSSSEYRRLSEMAVTAQEHTDLKLGEVTMQIRQLRNQLESVQKTLKDAE